MHEHRTVAGVDPEPGIPAAEGKRRRTNDASEKSAAGGSDSEAGSSAEGRREVGSERTVGADSAQRTAAPAHQMRKRSRNASSERGGEGARRLVRQREDQARGRGRRRGGGEGHDQQVSGEGEGRAARRAGDSSVRQNRVFNPDGWRWCLVRRECAWSVKATTRCSREELVCLAGRRLVT